MVKYITELMEQQEGICTTADICSALKKSYIGVTAHWVSADLKRQSVALACERIKGSHTYDVIAGHLLNINSKYGLDHRQTCFTITDNGSNMVKAFAEYQEPEAAAEYDTDSD